MKLSKRGELTILAIAAILLFSILMIQLKTAYNHAIENHQLYMDEKVKVYDLQVEIEKLNNEIRQEQEAAKKAASQ